MPGCLAFIILALLGLVASLVLGAVFGISDAIKWVLTGGWLQWLKDSGLIFWIGGLLLGVPALYWLYELATGTLPSKQREGRRASVKTAAQKESWGELDKPGNEQKQREYWHWLDQPEQRQIKEDYIGWLRAPENAWRLKGYERWVQAEGGQREENPDT